MKLKEEKLLKLPGLVDVHVHLREPGGTHKEDFGTGTMAAVAGGYTQILDMPNNIPPTTNLEQLATKEKLAKGRIWCDVGLNFGATKSSIKFYNPQLYKNVFGLKIYMSRTTGPILVTNKKEKELIFKKWNSPVPIMVHAQDDLVEEAMYFAKKYNRKVHVCHLTANQLKYVKKAKKDELSITTEVTPHHLFLTNSNVKKLGPFGIMKPPLTSKADQNKLWENIKLIDLISTDHAPHTIKEKLDQTEPKFGVPGLETALPLILTAVKQKRLSLEKAISLLSTKAREIFKLPNEENTYILVDLNTSYKVEGKNLFTKAKWTSFEGVKVQGKVIRVVIRGKDVYKDGKFIGKPAGKLIRPNI